MPRRKYEARQGGPLTNQQARILGCELEAMERDGLATTPNNIVQRAKPKSSPIHGMFNWDDKKAAHRWRIDQARGYVASLVTIEIKTKKPKKEFFSIAVRPEKGAGAQRQYVRKEVVVFDDAAKLQVSARLYKQLSAIADQAEQLALTVDPSWAAIVQIVRGNQPSLAAAVDEAVV